MKITRFMPSTLRTTLLITPCLWRYMYFSISSEMTQDHFFIGAIFLTFTPCICTLNPSLGSILAFGHIFNNFGS